MRRGVHHRRGFGRRRGRQLVVMDRQRTADPERIGHMIPPRVRRVGMDQNTQPAVIEHQPRHQAREDVLAKRDLDHRAIMRADPDIVPAADLHSKALADPPHQPFSRGARRRRVVVDVRMIARDLGERARAVGRGGVGHRWRPHGPASGQSSKVPQECGEIQDVGRRSDGRVVRPAPGGEGGGGVSVISYGGQVSRAQ